ncbi:MAG: hypothetical protein ACI81T_000192 [Bacteroidia bacterium]
MARPKEELLQSVPPMDAQTNFANPTKLESRLALIEINCKLITFKSLQNVIEVASSPILKITLDFITIGSPYLIIVARLSDSIGYRSHQRVEVRLDTVGRVSLPAQNEKLAIQNQS